MWLGLLLVGVLLLHQAGAINKHKLKHHPKYRHTTMKRSSEMWESGGDISTTLTPTYQQGREYCFIYKSQVSTGYAPWVSAQRAMTRLQCKTCMAIQSADEFVLRMEKCRLGQRNDEPGRWEEQPWNGGVEILPMGAFQPVDRQTARQIKEKLELPVQFNYIDGSVERLQFHQDDQPWSKNIKKAVLNLIQINLKTADQQQQQQGEEPEEYTVDEQFNDPDSQKSRFGNTFTTMEMGLEGECPTTYTILSTPNTIQHQVNITKSINFQRCHQLADVGYGFQVEPIVQSEGPQQQDINTPSSYIPTSTEERQQHNQETGVVIPNQKLGRSTVIRYILAKMDRKHSTQEEQQQQPQQKKIKGVYEIERVEVLSEYTVKSSQAESSQAMQTIAAAELVALPSKSKSINHDTGIQPDSSKEETLLYNADAESQEKKFYMYGDQEFVNGNSPFPIQNQNPEETLTKAQTHLRELSHGFGKKNRKNGGIESASTIEHFEKLVDIIRMCTLEQLKKVDEKASQMCSSDDTTSNNQERVIYSANGEDRVNNKHLQEDMDMDENENENKGCVSSDLFTDALAVAATHNTMVLLAEKINQMSSISEIKAVQLLKVLGRGAGLPAPSDSQVDTILKVCKSDAVSRSSMALKQSCWLTFGTMVGELNQQAKKATLMQKTACPMCNEEKAESKDSKLQLYSNVFIQQLNSAQDGYERVLALKCIGNAGLQSTVPELKKIINSQDQSPMVRINAIDALRRLRHQLTPKAIQSIVLPIYMNTEARPELRMNAFSMVIQTRPSSAVIDQIAYTMANEKSEDVQAFVYSAMKSAAQSPVPEHQEMANHFKSALKLAHVDENELEAKQVLGSSQRWTSAFYSHELQEGAFLNFVSMFSANDRYLPSHISVGLDTYFNDQFNRNTLRMSFCQKDIEKLVKQIFQGQDWDDSGRDDEGQEEPNPDDTIPKNPQQQNDENQEPKNKGFFGNLSQQLRNLFGKLKIKARGKQQDQGENEKETQHEIQSPYLIISIRLNDVDVAMIPLNTDNTREGTVSRMRGMLVNALHNLFSRSHTNTFQLNSAIVLNSRASSIPTSVGMSLRMSQSMYIIGQVKGHTQPDQHHNTLNAKLHPNINWVQVQKMEARTMVQTSGVRSSRSVAINLPLETKFEYRDSTSSRSFSSTTNQQKKSKFSVKVPQKFTRLVAVHSLPTTYVKKISAYSTNDSHSHYHRVRAVHNRELEDRTKEVSTTVGEEGLFRIPIRIHGHFQTPRQIFNLKELVKVIMTGQNHLSMDLVPNRHSMPREIQFTVSADLFEPTANSPAISIRPRLQDFYTKYSSQSISSNKNLGRNQYQQDSYSTEDEDEPEPSQQFSSNYRNPEEYVNAEKHNYKHSIKAIVETIGGPGKPNKAEAQLESVCDSRMRACEAVVWAKTSLDGDRKRWSMDAQVQTLYPQHVSDIQELMDANSVQHQQFFCHTDVQWGDEDQDQEHTRQQIQLNIQGQPSERVLSAIHSSQQDDNTYAGRRQSPRRGWTNTQMPFVDRYQMVAEYTLKPHTKYFFQRQLEQLKARNFWTTSTKIFSSSSSSQSQSKQREGVSQKGQVECLFTIEPSTGRQANLTIQTDRQLVKIRAMELPLKVRPMALVRPQSQSSHSTIQVFSNLIQDRRRIKSRAQCKVGMATVDTFDGMAYKAPISKCYTLLAKDCSDENHSKFAVLMRSLQTDGEQKKLKVITPEKEIVVQPRDENSMRIRVNDKEYTIRANNEADRKQQQAEKELRGEGIELDRDPQNPLLVYVDVDSLAVKFNGKTAKIQISEEFKNRQCGLCGNYNDDEEDELRNNQNELDTDVKDFHRSFTLTDGECDADEHQNFHQRQQPDAFSHDKRYQQQQPEQVEPEDRTVIMEYNHKVCFSLQPVKQCPEGYQAGEQDDEDAKQLLKRPKVQFSCLDRQSIEAKRLRKIVRKNGVANLSDYNPSFYEVVVIPETCVQY